jgi:hypothetical protein
MAHTTHNAQRRALPPLSAHHTQGHAAVAPLAPTNPAQPLAARRAARRAALRAAPVLALGQPPQAGHVATLPLWALRMLAHGPPPTGSPTRARGGA